METRGKSLLRSPLINFVSKHFKITAVFKSCVISSTKCVGACECLYKMKTFWSLPPSEGNLQGKSLLEEQIVTLTHSAAHTLPLLPCWGNSWQRQPYLSLWQQLSCRFSHRPPSPAALCITNHISEHTHTEYAQWHTGWWTTKPHVSSIFTHTHNRQYKPGRVFHPQFSLHRLMAQTNLNDVLAHTSCSSEDKHISLYGHSCKCARIFCYIHYHRWDC